MGYLARNNKTFKIADTQKLFDQALETINLNDWNKAVEHVLKVEQSYRNKDRIMDIDVQDIVFKL